MLHQKFNQNLCTYVFKQNIDLLDEKIIYVSSYSTIQKAGHKNNPWTHSPQQDKIAVLTFQSLNSHKVAATIRVIYFLGIMFYHVEVR